MKNASNLLGVRHGKKGLRKGRSIRRAICAVALLLCFVSGGCASYKPVFDPQAAYFSRLATQEKGPLKVSVVGLGPEESKKTFGVNLAASKILPVWIKIENNDPEHSYFFMERAVDPEYYTPGEAAFKSQYHIGYRVSGKVLPEFLVDLLRTLFLPFDTMLTGRANERMRAAFQKQSLKYGWIPPKETRSGFVFIPLGLGTKEIPVDLYADALKTGADKCTSFFFFIPVPGIKQDYRGHELETYYAKDQMMELRDEAALMKAVEELPSCMTNRKKTKSGDPVNLVMIGELDDLLASFSAAKWAETEIISLATSWKMVQSVLFAKRYEYSPVSPLFLYGRSQDIAFQKARDTINERMHLRLWSSPLRYQGKPVWVGSVSRDIGVRLTTKTWNLTTHKIDPDIDEAALYTFSDLLYWHRIEKFAVATGVPPSTEDKPAANLTGDPYYTSGKRMVILLPKTRHMDFPDRMGVQDSKAA